MTQATLYVRVPDKIPARLDEAADWLNTRSQQVRGPATRSTVARYALLFGLEIIEALRDQSNGDPVQLDVLFSEKRRKQIARLIVEKPRGTARTRMYENEIG